MTKEPKNKGPADDADDDDGASDYTYDDADARSETSYYSYTQSAYSGYYSESKASERSTSSRSRSVKKSGVPANDDDDDGGASEYSYDYDTDTASVYTDAYTYSQYTDYTEYTEDDASVAAPGSPGKGSGRGRSPNPRPSTESQRDGSVGAAVAGARDGDDEQSMSPAAAAAAAEIDAVAEEEAAKEAAELKTPQAERKSGEAERTPYASAQAQRPKDGDDDDDDAYTEYTDDTYSVYSDSEYTYNTEEGTETIDASTAYDDEYSGSDNDDAYTEVTDYTEYSDYESVVTAPTEYTDAYSDGEDANTEKDYELAALAREKRKESELVEAAPPTTIASFSEDSPEAQALKNAAKELCTTHPKPLYNQAGDKRSRAELDANSGAIVAIAPAAAAENQNQDEKSGIMTALRRRLDRSAQNAAAAATEAACAELRRRADAYGPSPLEYWCHLSLAAGFAEHGWFEEALPSLRACVALSAKLPTPHFRMGNALFALGRMAEAREAYEAALQACVDAIAAEASEAFANGDVDAGRELQKKVHPLLPKVHTNLGVAFETEGLLMSACEHYRESALLNPTHHKSLKLLGSALLGLGEHEAAREALGHAILLNPEYADAHCDLGLALADGGDYASAKSAFEEAVRLDEKHASAWYNLGNTCRMLQEHEAAVTAYEKCEEVNPSNWRAALNASTALLSLGRSKEAHVRLERAWQQAGQRVDLYHALQHLRAIKANKDMIGALMHQHHAQTLGSGSGASSNGASSSATKKDVSSSSSLKTKQENGADKAADLSEIELHEKDENGETATGVDTGEVAVAPFGAKNDRVSSSEHMHSALEVHSLQRRTRVGRCPVKRFRDEATESNLPEESRASTSAGRGRPVRKARIERIFRRVLQMEGSKQFSGAMRCMNERVLRTLDKGRRGMVDLSLCLAVLAPLARGTLQERLSVVFELLLWRRPELSAEASLTWEDTREYFVALRAVCSLPPGAELPTSEGDLVSAAMFGRYFTDDDIGIGGVLKALMKMERAQHVRHGLVCAVTHSEIVGPRYTCVSPGVRRFDLSAQAYAERRVPKEANKSPPSSFIFEESLQPPTPGEVMGLRLKKLFRGG